ncbi:MAG: hypothetical protein OXJ52_08010 [Oligoflexia bacterium]|nr:hypothetical protein [Oligoflexia bacterium]
MKLYIYLVFVLGFFISCSDSKHNINIKKRVENETPTTGESNELDQEEADTSNSSPPSSKTEKALIVKCFCTRDQNGVRTLTYGSGKDLISARNDADKFCVDQGFSAPPVIETYTFEHDTCVVIDEITE